MLNNMKIGTRLMMLLTLLLLLMVGVGVAGLLGMNKTNEGLRVVYEDHTVALGQISLIASLTLDSRLNMSLLLLDPSPPEVARHTGIVENHIQNHCCPVKTRIDSTGCSRCPVLICSRRPQRLAGWAFSRTV